VVGVRRFARRNLPQAQAQPLAPNVAAETSALTEKPGVLARLVEDGIFNVRHAKSVSATQAEGRPTL
jgi:hypothetical protein